LKIRKATVAAALIGILVFLIWLDRKLLFRPDQMERRFSRAIGRRFRVETGLECVEFHPLSLGRFCDVILRPAVAGTGVEKITVGDLLITHHFTPLLLGRYQPKEVVLKDVRLVSSGFPALFAFVRDHFRGRLFPGAREERAIGIERLAIRFPGRHVPFARVGDRGLLFKKASIILVDEHRWRFRATMADDESEEISLRGEIDFPSARWKVRLKANNMDCGKRVFFGLPPRLRERIRKLRTSGPLDMDMTLDAPILGKGRSEFAIEVDCYNLSIHPDELSSPLTNISGTIRTEGRSLQIEGMRGLWRGSALLLHGEIADVIRPAGLHWSIRITPLVLAGGDPLPLPPPFAGAIEALNPSGSHDLTMDLDAPGGRIARASVRGRLFLKGTRLFLGLPVTHADGRISFQARDVGAVEDPMLTGRISLSRLHYRKLRVEKLTAGLRLEGEGLRFSNLKAWALGGRMDGELRFSTRRSAVEAGQRPHSTLDLTFSHLQLMDLFSLLFPPPAKASGLLSGRLLVKTKPGSAGELGGGRLRFARMDLFGIPTLRDLKRLLVEKGADPGRFESGTASFRIFADRILLEDIRLVGGDFALTGKGSIAESGEIDLRLHLGRRKIHAETLLHVSLKGEYLKPRTHITDR
jgi:hypothetical protein